jgi:transcription initiation factor IIE alpha subunit
MKKISESILFQCPECCEHFEFDSVGEYEFVPCPICGTNNVTVKKDDKLMLQTFKQTQNSDQAILA